MNPKFNNPSTIKSKDAKQIDRVNHYRGSTEKSYTKIPSGFKIYHLGVASGHRLFTEVHLVLKIDILKQYPQLYILFF